MREIVSPKKSTTFTSIKSSRNTYSKSTGYHEAGVRREIQTLSMASIGTRNDSLNRASFNCGRLVAACPELREFVINALQYSAISIGLTEAEAARTISSAFKAGLAASRG